MQRSSAAGATTSAHGMGGVGKTLMAVQLIRDPEIGAMFERLLWVTVGQQPDVLQVLCGANAKQARLVPINLSLPPSIHLSALVELTRAAGVSRVGENDAKETWGPEGCPRTLTLSVAEYFLAH